MAVKRTPYRLIFPFRELVELYNVKEDSLPDCMERLPDGIHMGIYLTEEQFIERQGELFPRCPVTGAFCNWDHDYNAIADLF